MRLLILIAVLLLASCAAQSVRDDPEETLVVAQLISVHPAPFGCGAIHVGSPAIYKVLEGPENLKGKEINVLVGCIEMPRSMYRRYAGGGGDLEEFIPGETHRLSLSKRNTHDIEVPDLPAGTYSYYLLAASRYRPQPNNSFKPKPLRGSA